MEAKNTNSLKQEIERKFGRRVLSSADCYQLCSEIAAWTKTKVSFNTLRRFFNLMKADHHPSLYTLNTLSSYCGFSSFDDFMNSRMHGAPTVNVEASVLLNYLVMLFKNVEITDINDATYFTMVQLTINFMEQHSYLVDRFQKEIAQTRNGQRFYYEQFIHIDKLNSFYGEGLQYYLYEKKCTAAQLFGRSLLCFRGWLTMNDDEVKAQYSLLLRYELDKVMHPSVCARYFAAHLFYADIAKEDKGPILERARRFYVSLIPHKEHYVSFFCFEIILSEVLILTGQFEEALFYIDELFARLKRYVPSYIDVVLLETICLYRAIVFAFTYRKAKVSEILSDLSPYNFCFLSRQYLTILYLLLKRVLHLHTDEMQLQHLVEQTGFKRLTYLWTNTCPINVAAHVFPSQSMGKTGQDINVVNI